MKLRRWMLTLALSLTPNLGAAGSLELPLSFEENRGQLPAEFRFAARSPELLIGVTPDSVEMRARDGSSITLRFEGRAGGAAVEGDAPLPGVVHYYRGSDPEAWIVGLRTFERVRFSRLWPGIDAVIYGAGSRFELDFVVASGADTDHVQMKLEGATSMSERPDGALDIQAGATRFGLAAPRVYQEGPDGRQMIAAAYRVLGEGRIAFEIAEHDTGRPLVIDPVLLGYSTRHGGDANDRPHEIVVGPVGEEIYIAGETRSSNFLGSGPTAAADLDGFVTKLSADGSAVEWTAILGGTLFDLAYGLTVDSAGNAYVAGHTESENFPLLSAADATFGDGSAGATDTEAFLSKLSSSGVLLYSTFFGGVLADGRFNGGVALGPTGVAYITSRAESAGLATFDAYQSVCVVECAFVAGFDTLQSGPGSLVYATYVSGDSNEGGLRIGLDAADRIYVMGFTGSDVGLVADVADPLVGFQASTGDLNNRDHFLVVLDPSLGPGTIQRVYSTYIGGLGDEFEEADMHVGPLGKVWITAQTDSDSGANPLIGGFPVLNAFQASNAGAEDGYVVALDSMQFGAASQLWTTFLGGSGADGASGIARDSTGNLWVALSSSSADFPLDEPMPMFPAPSGGAPVGIVVRLDSTGQLDLSTPISSARHVALDSTDRPFITGSVPNPLFPQVDPLPPSPVGGFELFLARLDPVPETGLTLEITDSVDPAATSDTWAMRYLVTNHGDVADSGITVTSTAPVGPVLNNPAPCFFNAGGIECGLFEALAPGENAPMYLRLVSNATGTFGVSASVSGNEVDPDASDNSDAETTDVDAAGSLPTSSLKLADIDAIGLTFDIGAFALDTREGVLATANGSEDDGVNLMVFDGSIPLHVYEILGQGLVAFGFVERTTWTPSNGDGGDLFGLNFNALADRVFAIVDQYGHVELWSAAPGSPGVLIDEGFVSLDSAKAFSLVLGASQATVFYDGLIVAQGDPYPGGGSASSGTVGDDMVISVSHGHEFLGSAVINDRFVDSDTDGIADVLDNCPFAANGSAETAVPGVGNQADSNGNARGDACECGDVDDDGDVTSADVDTFRLHLANPPGAPLSAAAIAKCNVIAPVRTCDVLDVTVLRRDLGGMTPTVAQACSAALP